MSRPTIAAAVWTAAPASLAVAAVVLASASTTREIGYAVLCLALLASAFEQRRPQLGTQLPARLLAAAAVVALAVTEDGEAWPALVAGALLLGVLLAEPLLHRLARPWYAARRLPTRLSWAAAAESSGSAWWTHTAAVALAGLAMVLELPAWAGLIPAVAAAGLATGLAVDGLARWRAGHREELAALHAAVERHGPRFVLYFSAPPDSGYQATMWLPHLHRLSEPFLVVLAEEHHLPAISRATDAPVVVHHTFAALEATLTPTVRAAFYVNNGMKNAHCVRFTQLMHIQLYHGDSDKAVTASPLNAMYDKIFVAGQAAVDRFAHHGVRIPSDKFVLVGRPQVAELAVADQPVGAVDLPTVLYAPTWAGAHSDSNYCSLPIVETIVQGLLDRGVQVILRAHPYAAGDRRTAADLRRAEQLLARDRQRTGRDHRWGRAASAPGLFACMDAADAMICDVSAVASDFLYSGKPFAITDMVGAGEAFVDTFPVARAAYRLDRDADNLGTVLDDLLQDDPLAATRRKLRSYYLGDASPEEYAGVFVAAAQRWI